MFTGLIEANGIIRRIERHGAGATFTFGAPPDLVSTLRLGDSVACDGACLTVVRFDSDWFTVDASAETIRCTTLSARRVGDHLHLERALALGDRLGGHIVAGHIDATGEVVSKQANNRSIMMHFRAPDEICRYLIPKGSICIDGVNLTVNTVDDEGRIFSVWLIPHTQSVVRLHHRSVGDQVNLEADLLGKYVERLLSPRQAQANTPQPVDLSLLARTGFLKS